MNRYLTILFYELHESHLYRDNGGIPYALSKYHNWSSHIAFLSTDKYIDYAEYKKYVKIIPINNCNNKFFNNIKILYYVWNNAHKYDVINFYFVKSMGILVSIVAKLRNPNIIVYVKLDLGRYYFNVLLNNKSNKIRAFKNLILGYVSKWIDLYTVETNAYVEYLNKLKRFSGKVRYLPNGYFGDLVKVDSNIKKEKIILTVGRLGTKPKNTEMLVEAIEGIEPQKLDEWKIYLVGSMTEEFKNWLEGKMKRNPFLKEVFVCTGNISDKRELYNIYAKSSVFVLSSRHESWGLVVTEAMSYGCYPIVTDCCDAFYEVLDDTYSKIVPNEDQKKMQAAIEDVLDNKVNYLQKGYLSMNFAKNNLDWKMITYRLDRYFKEIYENRTSNKKC